MKSFKATRFCVAYQNSVGGMVKTPYIFLVGAKFKLLSCEQVFDDCREKKEVGDVTVELRFKENLPATVLLLAFGYTDDVGIIDATRTLTIDSKAPY